MGPSRAVPTPLHSQLMPSSPSRVRISAAYRVPHERGDGAEVDRLAWHGMLPSADHVLSAAPEEGSELGDAAGCNGRVVFATDDEGWCREGCGLERTIPAELGVARQGRAEAVDEDDEPR